MRRQVTCMRVLRATVLCVCIVSCRLTQAGGGPQNVLIVVNDRSLESLELGQYYREQHGIPERNVCHISVPACVDGFPATYSVNTNAFETLVRSPALNHIRDNGLTNQIDVIVFSRDIPYKVNGLNGITAAMFYGYQDSDKTNLYYRTEHGFSRRETTNDYYLSFMLTSWELSGARALVDNSAQATASMPTGTVYLMKTQDTARNIRYHQFNDVKFLARFLPAPVTVVVEVQYYLDGNADVLGHTTGQAVVQRIENNTFLPGALADHMTSYGGRLFDSWQTSILDWTRAGCSASYGTVSEPHSRADKFPHSLVHFWYARGFSAGESYWMSVQNPYQGLFVGEPLVAPYAEPCSVVITTPAPDETVSGVVTVTVAAAASGLDKPVARMEFFVDDLFADTVTNVPPTPGNTVTATIDGTGITYTVAVDDTLYDVAEGLALTISNSAAVPVDAYACGDRVMLVYTNFGAYGTGVTYSVAASTGAAARLTLWATNFTDSLLESEYPARELVQCLESTPKAGDLVRLTITLEGGTKTTNEIVAGSSSTVAQLMTDLLAAVTNDTILQGTNGVTAMDYRELTTLTEFWLQANSPGPKSHDIHVDYDIERAPPTGFGIDTSGAFESQMDDNADVLTARGMILLSCGQTNLEADIVWDSSVWPNGEHLLTVIAYEGTAVRTQGRAEAPVIVSNSPLSCAMVTPTNQQAFLFGDSVSCTAEVANAVGPVTQVVFFVEGKPFRTLTNAPFACEWHSLSNGAGQIGVRARAWDSTGDSAWSPSMAVDVQRYWDADHDETADEWERRYYGDIWDPLASGTNNPDGDGFDNALESIYDTDPTNAESYYRLLSFQRDTNNDDMAVTFISSDRREYTIGINEQTLLNTNAWLPSSDSPFTGSADEHTWVDAGSTNRPHPRDTTNRFYRISVSVP